MHTASTFDLKAAGAIHTDNQCQCDTLSKYTKKAGMQSSGYMHTGIQYRSTGTANLVLYIMGTTGIYIT